MKLNFWQWLGLVLLVIGVSWWIYGNYIRPRPTVPESTPAPTVVTPTPNRP
jgi:hypothetical protein